MANRKKTSTNTLNQDYFKNECGTMYALILLSGRWKMTILHKLSKKSMRFKELKASIPNISDRMLTLHLKEMENDGLIERNVFAEVPPRVEYKLTPSTVALVSIWDQLEVWGSAHRKILDTRSFSQSSDSKKLTVDCGCRRHSWFNIQPTFLHC